MKIEFFDANLFAGLPQKKVFRPAATQAALMDELDRQSIEKALVWHVAQRDFSPPDGNEMLSGFISGCERLYGCWTILPPQTDAVVNVHLFERMKENRIVALRAFPNCHHFFLERTVFGDFLDELSERKIPLLLSMLPGNSWQGIYTLLKDFPSLTCILCDIGIWGVDRYTWPLLQQYERVYLETSLLSLGYGQLEATVKKYGAERLVFGSGFPERYTESSVLDILHSDIADADREKIASLNLEGLISGAIL